ncbi:MAG: ATP-binding cassette domain-containing protein [Bacillus sp. (in: Bacteria)]|nr:ATP-binding cassette domain-containing protein [Bacillus sp. (in: firmicutes)]MCM1427210.1 ATP-binding cassette domain-containing protein [Eubacterium sp.]
MTKRNKIFLKKSMVILFWLCAWQAAAALINNTILLVGPLQAGRAFLENMVKEDFIWIILASFSRIGLGFLAAFLSAFLLGALSYRYQLMETFLAPLITTLKSVPVASFVVLLLIWFGSGRLSFFISFFIVFPNVYVNTIAGMKSADAQLLEMARVFGVSRKMRFFYIYRPALMPYLISCLQVSLGMAWKSGVAAEVIGMPSYSLGERIYMSKVYLDTAGLFAWTFLVICLSFLFEKAVLYGMRRFAKWQPRLRSVRGGQERESAGKYMENDIFIRNIRKFYDGKRVLDNFSLTLKKSGHYCLMAPSGGGKTTLLRLLCGMEKADDGVIEGVPARVGMVFQEDRLCESYDVITNLRMAVKRESVTEEALKLLPKDCLTQPVSELSGGMRRRCAILRAMLSDSDIIVMDEPFTGLDEENRQRAADYILEQLKGRTLLVTTHRKEDVELLGAKLVELQA